MNELQVISIVPTKTEQNQAITDFVNNGKGTPLEKHLTLKMLENMVKEGLALTTPLAKDDFLKTYNGTTKMEILGVTISLKDMSKSITLKDPTYEYSDNVTKIENEILTVEENLKYLKDKLKLEKTMEINSGVTKKLDPIFEDPKEAKENFQLTITMRK